MRLNKNYDKLETSYLFTQVGMKIKEYTAANPDIEVIKLSIGDVTRPLAPCVTAAMAKACAEMGVADTFRGYGDEQGYMFLREAIARYYSKKGVELSTDEIFVSDGAKSDLGNILDLFSDECTVVIPDPVYPVYVDTNIMAGRKIRFLDSTPENGFLPMPDEGDADIIYLCSPNNPTGAVYSGEQLTQWIDYALSKKAVILFDSAYEAFVSDASLPSSIYEIAGAEKCAIEFCSLSKTAGFTGVRCGYTIVPLELESDSRVLNKMWLRRQTTKFNGVSYIVQRGAEAVFSDEGILQTGSDLAYYKKNAAVIAEALNSVGASFCGGVHSPYIWLNCPDGFSSWEFFDKMLYSQGVAGTPGSGFGKNGEGYIRLTSFNTYEKTCEAVKRLIRLF